MANTADQLTEHLVAGTQPSTTEQTLPSVHFEGVDPVVLDGLQRTEHRLFVLRVCMDLEDMLKSDRQSFVEYTNMNAYERLIIHRVADHYQMDHVAYKQRMGVTVYKNEHSQLSQIDLKTIPGLSSEDGTAEKTEVIPPMKIIQRGGPRKFDGHNNRPHEHHHGGFQHRPYRPRTYKSYEEKEAAYQQARAKIFQDSEQGENHDETAEPSSSTSTYRPRNFVPRMPSSAPRPRHSHMHHGYRPHLNAYQANGANDGSAPSGAMPNHPYMYNPAMMPFVYTSQNGEKSSVAGMPPGGIYVDPYTGAQFFVPMSEYFDPNTSADSHANSPASQTGVQQENEASTAKTPKGADSKITPAPKESKLLPIQFGSLTISGENSDAVTFKPSLKNKTRG